MGAWIETLNASGYDKQGIVAPYVGAWIETILSMALEWSFMSHPMWVRGLKPPDSAERHRLHDVAPYVGAWIETWMACAIRLQCMSHPMWVRGLKHHLPRRVDTAFSRTLCGCVD